MKTLKIAILILFMGIITSCKNNNDGYSDEIETNQTPLDSTSKAKDSTNTPVDPSSNTQNPGVQQSDRNASKSTAGQGSGPSASAVDGATYTSESGVQKDSVKLKKDSVKGKKR
ncbi:MAG: hypothetical protein J7574_07245 [Flavobacterium sp.]|uniref:hypothetical protein n=1 Tax=Flavobacterium sp. TaxID=239 RepID=UPI001B14AA13|nr:hypothetical protein [Flavobacterium sp.]MBO9583936.1 hypothetical protein [Flavobacterium sp.]